MARAVFSYVAFAVKLAFPAGLAFASAGLLGACVIEAGAASLPTGVAVAGPPPQPMQEAHSPPPGGPAVWVAGYWHWTGMQYTWIPGHWDRPPAGAMWRPPRYVVREGTYFYEPGGWWRPR